MAHTDRFARDLQLRSDICVLTFFNESLLRSPLFFSSFIHSSFSLSRSAHIFFICLVLMFVSRCNMLRHATSRRRCSPSLIRNEMTRSRMKAYAMPFNTLYVISGAKISPKVNYATIAAKTIIRTHTPFQSYSIVSHCM